MVPLAMVAMLLPATHCSRLDLEWSSEYKRIAQQAQTRSHVDRNNALAEIERNLVAIDAYITDTSRRPCVVPVSRKDLELLRHVVRLEDAPNRRLSTALARLYLRMARGVLDFSVPRNLDPKRLEVYRSELLEVAHEMVEPFDEELALIAERRCKGASPLLLQSCLKSDDTPECVTRVVASICATESGDQGRKKKPLRAP